LKYILFFLLIISAVGIGIFLGTDFLDDFGLLIGIFVIFPAAYIFGAIFIGNGKKDMKADGDEKSDRFSKWE